MGPIVFSPNQKPDDPVDPKDTQNNISPPEPPQQIVQPALIQPNTQNIQAETALSNSWSPTTSMPAVPTPPSNTTFQTTQVQAPTQDVTPQPIGQAQPALPYSQDLNTGAYGAPVSESSFAQIPAVSNTSKKKFFTSIGASFLALLLTGGAVFGYVLPNQPGNVWKTGMGRTNKALTAVVDKATSIDTIKSFEKSEITATITASFGKSSYNGTLATKFSQSVATGNLKLTGKQSGESDKVYTLDYMSQLAAGEMFPTAYFKLSGLKSVSVDDYIPGLGAYDNKWISIDKEYYKLLGLDESIAGKSKISANDSIQLAKSITSVTTDRLFTIDPKKAVFEQRQSLGKEKVDDTSAFHYVVGINKANAANYCKALIDSVTSTKAFKELAPAGTTDADKETYKDSCNSGTKDIKDSDTFDMWIDAKYKLIYKIRISDKSDEKSYLDIGQKYKGGDDVTLFVHGLDIASQTEVSGQLTSNLKNAVTNTEFNVKGKISKEPYNVKVTMIAKPYSGDIGVKIPVGAAKIQDIFKALGFDPEMLAPSSYMPVDYNVN